MKIPAPHFDTAQLGPLRDLIARIPALQASIGNIVQFRLIVDANFVVGELLHRIRRPDYGPSAFEEMVKATVIDVFAPRWLDTEMTTSAIPKAAKRSKVSESDLRARWAEFRTLLKWDDSLREPGIPSGACCDPKDLPYVQLQHKLDADGILSKDAHIARMGGHPLTLDFVLSARRYARSAVTTVSIRVLGVVLPSVALVALAESLRTFARGFAHLPEPIKALIVIGGIAALLHPTSRNWIADRCADAYLAVVPVLQTLGEIVGSLSATSTTAQTQALIQLLEIKKEIRPKRSHTLSAPRRRRRARAPIVTAMPSVG